MMRHEPSYALLTRARTATLVNNEDNASRILGRSTSESFKKAASEETNTLLFSDNRFAKYIVIPKFSTSRQIKYFVDNHFFKGLELNLPKKVPGAIISVIGGASYHEISSKLDLVVKRGFIKAAENLGAWIIDGGMHAGLMKYMGESIQSMAAKDIPLIGIAPLRKAKHWETLAKMQTMAYEITDVQEAGQDRCNLDPNHSHFILVDSEIDQWGEETEFLNNLRTHLKQEKNIPVIVIALNGGGVTLEVIAHGLEQGFPTIIVVGTGRVCDALAALVRVARKYKTIPESTDCALLENLASEDDLEAWLTFIHNEADSHVGLIDTMDKALKYYHRLKLFDTNELEHEGLDTLVLESYLATKATLAEKIEACIFWGDDGELVQDLIIKEGPNLKGINPHEMNLFLSLIKDRPNIFSVLCDNYAYFSFPLRLIYENNNQIKLQLNRGHKQLMKKITGWPDHVRDKIFGNQVNQRTQSTCEDFEEAMDIIADIGPVFAEYASLCSRYFDHRPPANDRANRRSFTDLLMWAVLTHRMALAKAIWKRTLYHAHSAVLACNLYRHLAVRAIRTLEYLDNATWFENEALRILNSLEYETAVEMIKFKADTLLGNFNLADAAAEGECKAVMAHPHMQQWLDELLYSYNGHGMSSSISHAHLLFDIVGYFPRLLYLLCKPTKVENTGKGLLATGVKTVFDQQLRANSLSVTNTPVKQKTEDSFLKRNPRIYFNIPIVKFWSSTIFYIAFLFLQAYVLLTLRDREITVVEYVLWGWLVSIAIEEVLEITGEDGSGYFSHFTNKMDITLIVLHMVYIGLRVAHKFTLDAELFSGAVNSLLAACVISWLRLMSLFPVSSTFGPLFFILIKLFTHDFILWGVLFTLFAISFQIGFTSLALQAGMSPSESYPHESGIFPVSYVAIIGEWSYLMDIMAKTPTGVVFLAIYAFIVQVMLINLLIAMMNDTYSSVRQNSDVEWKYFRHSFVQDNMAASPLPPPLNVIYFFTWILRALSNACKSKEPRSAVDDEREREVQKKEEKLREQAIAKVMRVTVDKLTEDNEKEERESSLVQIQLTKKAVWGVSQDLNKRELEKYINKLHLATNRELKKIEEKQIAQEELLKKTSEQLQEIEEKIKARDTELDEREARINEKEARANEKEARLLEKETRLENTLAQVTQQLNCIIQQNKS